MTSLALILLLLAAGRAEVENPALIRLDLACGDYVIVGRKPEGGATYAGTARIERVGNRLTVRRKVGAAPAMTLHGQLEPAEGREVFRFRGPERAPRTLTCLDESDLDNYRRLTCYWTYDSEPQPSQPGLETFFPTAAWPEKTPPESRAKKSSSPP